MLTIFGYIIPSIEVHSPLGISESQLRIIKPKIHFQSSIYSLPIFNIFSSFSIPSPNLNVYITACFYQICNSIAGMILFFLYASRYCALTVVCQTMPCVCALALFPNQHWVITAIGKSAGRTQHTDLPRAKPTHARALKSRNGMSASSRGASGHHPAPAVGSAPRGHSFASFSVLHAWEGPPGIRCCGRFVG